MRLARLITDAQVARMDIPDLDLDEVFLDALESVVLAALEGIGDDPPARFRFPQPMAVAQNAAKNTYLLQSAPSSHWVRELR